MQNTKNIIAIILLVVLLAACSQGDEAQVSVVQKDVAVGFSPYVGRTPESRTTHPAATSGGEITLERLKTLGFGVYAQYTSETEWVSYTNYTKATPFNFMWNQQVGWNAVDNKWTYEPVKYWPNDNNPADNESAVGSKEHSYLSFFAYAPYAPVPTPASGFDVKDVDTDTDGIPDHDGIVAVSLNSANANASYLYYRTSNETPFSPETSVDLLWDTQQNLFKMKDSGEGHVDGAVNFTFKHALSKVGIYIKTLIDRTDSYTSPAYSTDLDPNTRIFVESATLTLPDFYSEGKLMMTPADATPTAPRWDFTGLDAKKQTGLSFDSDDSNTTPDIGYAIRYADPNMPQDRADYELAKEDFDAMEFGVTSTERQLAANQAEFIFPPAGTSKALSVNLVYHVVTLDENLVLNSPKYYSDVTNNITAELTPAFTWEPNKKYKILMEPGLTSAKFTLAEIDEWGQVIIISTVVKEWDTVTKEVNIE